MRSDEILKRFDLWFNKEANCGKGYKELPALYYEIAKEAFLFGIQISHDGEGVTAPLLNSGSGRDFESEAVSAKRALNDNHNTLMRLVDAVMALQDPKGHIFHGGDVCTPECSNISDIIDSIFDDDYNKHCGYEECCGDYPPPKGASHE